MAWPGTRHANVGFGFRRIPLRGNPHTATAAAVCDLLAVRIAGNWARNRFDGKHRLSGGRLQRAWLDYARCKRLACNYGYHKRGPRAVCCRLRNGAASDQAGRYAACSPLLRKPRVCGFGRETDRAAAGG